MTLGPEPSASGLIGRQQLVSGVVASARRGVRQVVFTGRVGVGKSTVAAAAAARLDPGYVTVPVEGAADEQEVYVRVGRAVGVTASRGQLRDGVGRALGGGRVLVLDGVESWAAVRPALEQLAGPAGPVVFATAGSGFGATPQLQTVHVHPLPVPSPADEPRFLATNPSVRMFIERARRVATTFEPSLEDLVAIAELCRRLDGLPLALNLAASRISLMQPEALLREMRRLGPWRLVGLSLDDELARSVALLDDAGRRTLVALDTFIGGATVDALHAVAARPALADTFDALSSLVDLDLVSLDSARARYAVASAASSFIRSRDCGGDPEDVRRSRHADYFSLTARERRDEGEDPDLAIDHGNRLASVSWFRETGDHDRALRLLVDMAADFDRRGEPESGRQWLATALASAPDTDERVRARGHTWVARFIAERPDPVDGRSAVEHLLQARRLAEASRHEPTIFAVLFSICENHTLLMAFDLAEAAIEDGLRRSAGGRHPVAEAGFLTWKAVLQHQRGREEEAALVVARAIGMASALGVPALILRSCLVFLGLPRRTRNSVVVDSPSPQHLLDMARHQADLRSEGWILALVMGNAVDDGEIVRATAAARELLALSIRHANAPLGRLALAGAVRIAAARGGAVDSAVLAARIVGALDRHGAAMEASMAPHSYASFRRAVDDVARMLGASVFQHSRAIGSADAWHELTADVDRFLASPVDGDTGRGRSSGEALEALSPRELDVLDGLVAGKSNKDIAVELGLRPKTVMHHCASIYRKLSVPGRAGAVGLALGGGARGATGHPGGTVVPGTHGSQGRDVSDT